MKLFAIHDYDENKKKKGCICINDIEGDIVENSSSLNSLGWGIFWSVNLADAVVDEKGQTVRKACFCKDEDIICWFVDIDKGTKDDMFNKILNAPLVASKVIETRQGFHVYFKSHNATVDNFRIIQKRLIGYFDADPKCTDVLRLLRVPNFYNWKDKENPFLITLIHDDKTKVYDEKDMLMFLPVSKEEKKEKTEKENMKIFLDKKSKEGGQGFFDKLKKYNQKDLLERISGTSIVNGSVFTFVPTSNNKFNFLINNKDHGFFINEKGEIISEVNHSNNVFNFLKWYTDDNNLIYETLKNII